MQPEIAIVGDRTPTNPAKVATEEAVVHAGGVPRWVATDEVGDPRASLAAAAGILCAPGSPYRDMDGALAAIRHARERGIPFLGTCGGFQHAVIEVARDACGIASADHAESSPDAPVLAVVPLACSLVGQTRRLAIDARSRLGAIYGRAEADEPFLCSYGLAPGFEEPLAAAGLRVVARDDDGDARAVELDGHPFFVATLYVPQLGSRPGAPHPVVAALVDAARGA